MTIGLTAPRSNLIWSLPDRRALSALYHRCFQNYYHGHRFLNPDPHYITDVRLSINHWQIRDLVQVDPSTGAVYVTNDNSIRVLLMRLRKAGLVRLRNYLQLPYRPRCFNTTSGGLVVTGGVLTSLAKAYAMKVPNLTQDFAPHGYRKPAKGLFSVYSPAMHAEMLFLLGEMINNAVTIYPQGNLAASYTSYVCNNDLHLYVVDVSDLGVRGDRAVVCEPTISLNNVHQSPDGRLVTATGDLGLIYLLDLAQAQPVARTIRTPHDLGFGISYHPNEVLLAVAFQNGVCAVYDLRRSEAPLAEIRLTRAGHQLGAFRTCRFINSAVQDLLVVLEHVGRVHVIDYRDLGEQNHQVVVFPYALDQYALAQAAPLPRGSDALETDLHSEVPVYGSPCHFTAPLVYDYDYLADVNPKLFKNFVYEPAEYPVDEAVATECQDSVSALDPTGFNTQNQAQNEGTQTSPSQTQTSPSQTQSSPSQAPQTTERLRLQDECQDERRRHELYLQSVNHVNGEMEIAGIDWNDNQLYIGCEKGGVLVWDVNVRARRSCGSFSYV